jgi:hypothetical protein
MSSSEQGVQDGLHDEESDQQTEQVEQEPITAETSKPEVDQSALESEPEKSTGRASFVHGLAVGLGIGCLANFVITWVTVFFSPQLPNGVTYENLLAIFIYPMIYLLAVGLVALTAGVVREYFTRRT